MQIVLQRAKFMPLIVREWTNTPRSAPFYQTQLRKILLLSTPSLLAGDHKADADF
jgi:hypothetical protein